MKSTLWWERDLPEAEAILVVVAGWTLQTL
jgi:hypothetical protein